MLFRWIQANGMIDSSSSYTPSGSFDQQRFKEALENGINISGLAQEDVDRNMQSLDNFYPYPSLNGRSSKSSDIEKLLIEDVLKAKCNLANSPVVIIGDTELLLIFHKFKFSKPTDLSNLILFPSIWHLQKHLLESLMNDPLFSLLFIIYYYYTFYHHQADKRKKRLCDLRDYLAKRIEEHERKNNLSSSSIHYPQRTSTTDRRKFRKFIDEEVDDDDDDDEEEEIEEDTNEMNDEDGEIPVGAVNPSIPSLMSDEQMQAIFELAIKYIEYGLNANDLPNKMLKGLKMNYGRQKLIFSILSLAFIEGKEELKVLSEITPIAAAIYSLLEGIADTCFTPFISIVLKGDGSIFLSNFPDMIAILSRYGRKKVVEAYGSLLESFKRYSVERPDLLSFYLRHCTKSNDLFVELFNSRQSRFIQTQAARSFESVQGAGLLSMIQSKVTRNDSETLETKRIQSSLQFFNDMEYGHGESRLVETKLASKHSATEIYKSKQLIINYF